MTRLAVFDCDGTLVDSQANIVAAMHSTFVVVGIPAPAASAVRQLVGLSLAEIMAVLVPDGDALLRGELVDTYRRTYHAMRSAGALAVEPLYPGIAGVLAALEDDGWRLGIATGKSDRGLAHLLAYHDIAHHFVTLQTADRHPSKPHPAMLELAMHQAGALPGATVMIGDTGFDMAMAVAAGTRAIGVDWGYHTPDALRASGADAVVGDSAALLRAIA